MLHYNPFSWGNRGLAPHLLGLVKGLRALRPRPTLTVMLHERYVSGLNPKLLVMGSLQRLQLRRLLRNTDAVLASTEQWVRWADANFDGPVDRLCFDQRDRAIQLIGDLGCRGADQQRGVRFGCQRLPQQRVIETLVFTAEDYPEPAVERVDRLYEALAPLGRPQ